MSVAESTARPSSLADVPFPPYHLEELRGDLHHLIQPIIGHLRLQRNDEITAQNASLTYEIERLSLALALVDVAFGAEPWKDVDVRMLRAAHGCGYFRNEDGPTRRLVSEQHARGSGT